MKVASTTAAVAYANQLDRFNLGSTSTAQELVLLGRLDRLLSSYPPGMAIYELGAATGGARRSIQSVDDVRHVIRSRMQSKSHLLLANVGGKLCEKRRAMQRAEAELDQALQAA